ncbi:MAG: SDR family oxidoreductase [Spirochaetales bacterium]
MGREAKTAWVTGGGTGIGRGIAAALADDGYTVYITGRRSTVLEEAVGWYADRGTGAGEGELIAAPADVTSEGALREVLARIQAERDRLDVLVVSSGINVSHRSIEETTPDEWKRILEVNATGTFLVIKTALDILKKSASGLIVNVSSVAGLRPLAMAGVAYSASKYASHVLGAFAGNELAELGIRVTNVYPGEVNTPLLDERAEPPSQEKRSQMVQPEEIGRIVALIAALPATAHVSEIVLKPRYQAFV